MLSELGLINILPDDCFLFLPFGQRPADFLTFKLMWGGQPNRTQHYTYLSPLISTSAVPLTFTSHRAIFFKFVLFLVWHPLHVNESLPYGMCKQPWFSTTLLTNHVVWPSVSASRVPEVIKWKLSCLVIRHFRDLYDSSHFISVENFWDICGYWHATVLNCLYFLCQDLNDS